MGGQNYWAAHAASWARDTEFLEADLIIAEMGVNDGVSEVADPEGVRVASASLFRDLLDLPQRPAVLSLELVMAGLNRLRDDNLAMARLPGVGCVSEHPPSNVSKYSFGPGATFRWCSQWWLPPLWRAPILQALQVPIVSYQRDLAVTV